MTVSNNVNATNGVLRIQAKIKHKDIGIIDFYFM